MIIAFDVDGTLIDFEDRPKPVIMLLARALIAAGHTVIVWSGGGEEYAEQAARRLDLKGAICLSKFQGVTKYDRIDLAIDDEMAACLADQMLIVGRKR